MNKPEFAYSRAFGRWRVDKMTYFKNSTYGSKIAEFDTKEEARDEVYRLNGWKLPNNNLKK